MLACAARLVATVKAFKYERLVLDRDPRAVIDYFDSELPLGGICGKLY